MFSSYSIIAFSAAALLLPALVLADCECGYLVDDALYTDLIETDFLHTATISGDWEREDFVRPSNNENPYGRHALVDNVVANPLTSKDAWSGTGTKGGDAGVQLIVGGGIPSSGFIPTAEMATKRNDVKYGSFRAGMKLTGVNGTCAAFFFVCPMLVQPLEQILEGKPVS